MILLFFSTLGEWLAENAIAIVTLFLSQLGIAGGLLWKLSKIATTSEANGEQVRALAKTFADHADDLDEHRRDSSVHTTFEQRQAINAKFDRMETHIQDGHNRIENKIDRVLEWIVDKKR